MAQEGSHVDVGLMVPNGRKAQQVYEPLSEKPKEGEGHVVLSRKRDRIQEWPKKLPGVFVSLLPYLFCASGLRLIGRVDTHIPHILTNAYIEGYMRGEYNTRNILSS